LPHIAPPRQGRTEPRTQPAEEAVRLERHAALPGVESLVIERTTRLWRFYHETYTWSLVPAAGNGSLAGCKWWYRGRDHRLHPGGVALMEPGELHVTKRIEEPTDCWVALLSPALVETAARELGLRAPPHFRLAQSEEHWLIDDLWELRRALAEGRSVLEQQSRFAECLAQLLRRCGEVAPERERTSCHPAARRAREFLHSHYAEAVTLDELAALSDVSRFHLLRVFKQTYGLPPHRYQTMLRLAAARQQMRQGWRVAAVDVGFADQSHLGRAFRRYLGLTPRGFADGKNVPDAPGTNS
jgi:AraC-like DNA-binding protein